MKLSTLMLSGLVTLSAAQAPAPYTDPKSGITFNAFTHSSGSFFGLALSDNTTATDFIATIGGKGTGYTGVSLGGGMINKLLLLAWPNNQALLGSFRKTASTMSPPVATGTFTQTPIANGTYVNSTHWTYTFLCKSCILADGSTFKSSDASPMIGYAINASPPRDKASASSAVSKHTAQGQVAFDLAKARSKDFATWSTWAKPAVAFTA